MPLSEPRGLGLVKFRGSASIEGNLGIFCK
nr:unnamed protein product [Callosobruchus chinensis]